jgi:hypothetical protein
MNWAFGALSCAFKFFAVNALIFREELFEMWNYFSRAKGGALLHVVVITCFQFAPSSFRILTCFVD